MSLHNCIHILVWLFLIFYVILLKLQKISLPSTHIPHWNWSLASILHACLLSFLTSTFFLHLKPNFTLGYNAHISSHSRSVFSQGSSLFLYLFCSGLLINLTLRSLLHLLPVEGKPFLGFLNHKSYILATKLKTIPMWIIMCSNHEPS